jgi:hypothetical protein
MNDVRAVMSAARRCAFAMLENATYIQRELPRVTLDADLRAQAVRVCEQLIGTKHDILSEVDELDAVLAHGGSPEEIAKYRERIVRWLGEDVADLHELVLAVHAAEKRDPAFGTASVLITESAANIVRAFSDVKAAPKP